MFFVRLFGLMMIRCILFILKIICLFVNEFIIGLKLCNIFVYDEWLILFDLSLLNKRIDLLM